MKLTFNEYDNQNPKIWEMFEALTFEAIRKGFKHYGSKGIFELIRWNTKGEIKQDGYKVNNSYTPNYGDKFELLHPEYKGFFRKRSRK